MFNQIKGENINCKYLKATKYLHYSIWGGTRVTYRYRPAQVFPCHSLKEFKDSIEFYVRGYSL